MSDNERSFHYLTGKIMKSIAFFLFFFCLLFLWKNAYTENHVSDEIRLSQTASGRSAEYVVDLSEDWKFGGKGVNDASGESFDDSQWKTVSIPHTWNTEDGSDGDKHYERTAYWYRKSLHMDVSAVGKRVFLEFLGVNQQTDLYVNGKHIKLCGSNEYTHKGGYTAFRYDITDALLVGENLIAVKVENTHKNEIAPLSGDFNMYGGIYRRVYLITVNDVHFDLSDCGSSGLFLTTPNVRSKTMPDDFGTLNIRAQILNDSESDRTVTVTARIEGDNAPEDIQRIMTVPARKSVTFDETTFVPNPHLWQGIDYSATTDHADAGYTYSVTLEISDGDAVVDAVSDRVGFRYFYVDRDSGFFLNGKSFPLHGVNRHQFKEGLGSALTEMDHQEDMDLIMELGANTVRLCHYPQCDYIYDICDDNGLIVWTEIPLVNELGNSLQFLDATKNQLTELIRQQYNRPSVIFWGLENELKNSKSTYSTDKEVLAALDDLAHAEDRSGRYTTQAICVDDAMNQNDASVFWDESAETGWKSDLFAWNLYPGWYKKYTGTLESLIYEKSLQDSRPMAISEYGWGASAEQHELYPVLGKNDVSPEGYWHPEEYQCLMHENAIRSLARHNDLWAAYVWCMFDFDVDSRNEGSRAGQNDKGLVTNDRQIKKDSFYLYKANWNQREAFIHIASSRYTDRTNAETYVKAYSNCDSAYLYINGVLVGKMSNMDHGVFQLEHIELPVGESSIHVIGFRGEEVCDDACTWMLSAETFTVDFESTALFIDRTASVIGLPDHMTLGELKNVLKPADGAAYKLMSNENEVTDEHALISPDMTILVTYENENSMKTKEYLLIPDDNLLSGMDIWAASFKEENCPDQAADNDISTRWEALDNSYPQTITADLGNTYFLSAATIDWYSENDGYFAYSVEVSEDGENFVTAAQYRRNIAYSRTMDNLENRLARYVRITVHSCSNPTRCAAISGIRIHGWFMSSQEYDIDHDNRMIHVSGLTNLSPDELMTNLTLTGNCSGRIELQTDHLAEVKKIIVYVLNQAKLEYTFSDKYYSSIPAKNIWATSHETGNIPKNTVDGDYTSRWVAVDNSYPQSITIDMGGLYCLNEYTIDWFTKNNRHYAYTIEISEDGENFVLAADYRDNKATGTIKGELNELAARYFRINVLSCSDAKGYAAILEIEIGGWPVSP